MNAEKEKPETTVSRPANHMEVEGELSKLFYQRFGDGALPIIEAVFREWGMALGETLKAKSPVRGLKAAVETYVAPAMAREPKPEILESSDKRFEGKFFTCPYRLNAAGRPLCEAMIAMDKAMVETLAGEELEVQLVKTLAAPGDECCHAVIMRKTP
jgi:predicted hydrocarbon binding protein